MSLLAAGLAGCMVGPSYKRPDIAPVKEFRSQVGPSEASSLADQPWWQVFNDKALQALISEGLTNSYDLQVVVARDMFVVDNEREKEAAIERNNQVHARTLSVSRAPDRTGGSHILAYAHTARQQRESPLIGTPDEIVAKLKTLKAAGVEYVMFNTLGSRASLRCFAHEVMPYA